MTCIDALKALLEKVKAGTARETQEGWLHLPCTTHDDGRMSSHMGKAWHAYGGSLDAAKALHEAVLHERVFVEIEWSKRYEDESRVTLNLGQEGWVACSGTPARAWLCAILKALISIEESKE